MNLRAYKATGRTITLIVKLLRLKLRVTGCDRLPQRPVLFVVNHFTRFETVLVPHVIYKYGGGRTVRSLATHSVFKGLLGRYLRGVGVMSTRDPWRNRTIVRDLMTGRDDWVIYPEGGLVKNKKTVRKGRLHLTRPGREGPPHTGAAMLALKSQIAKRRFLKACARGDERRVEYYREAYGVQEPDDLATGGAVVVPVSITYHPLRSTPAFLRRLARWGKSRFDHRLLEELQVEASILLGASEISVHFGEAIEVEDYLDGATEVARKLVGVFSSARREDLLLRRQARRLTAAAMRQLYRSAEINLDHLFCYGLRAARQCTIPAAEFRRALCLAAMQLRRHEDTRVHPTLSNGVAGLIGENGFEPLDRIIDLARREGVLQLDGGHYLINRSALDETHDFHDIRLSKMVQVIANEVEAIEPAVAVLGRAVNGPSPKLRAELAEAMHDLDLQTFGDDRARWADPSTSRPEAYGRPFFLRARQPKMGVVLVHGYLSCPEQMRPLAEHLHAQGCSVYGVRLKAHGTAPAELAQVRWDDWAYGVEQGLTALAEHCGDAPIVAGGFSFGGALALLLAARRPDLIRGVFSANAPFRIRDPRAALVPMLVAGRGMMRRAGVARRAWMLANLSESPEMSYDAHCLHALHQLRLAVAASRRGLGRIDAPALIIQSDGDRLVSPASGRIAVRRLGSTVKRLLELPTDRHLVVRGEDSEALFGDIWAFLHQTLAIEPAHDDAE